MFICTPNETIFEDALFLKRIPKDSAHLYVLLAFYAIIAFLPTLESNEQRTVQKTE